MAKRRARKVGRRKGRAKLRLVGGAMHHLGKGRGKRGGRRKKY